ncbi:MULTISPECIES: alpha/beta family hydrolase [Sediminibacillus]|uniref:alpha/beta family hydrolase n=1 Tax=Sediminibacillus TaxID=482460 RepID=UPI0012967976|nr:alpha/beta family hydrolase [Sediminibacillus terrae]
MHIEKGIARKKEGESVPYRYFRNTPDNSKLCVMLPGLGYTTDQPLFYYATGLFLEKGFDVLHVQYEHDNSSFIKLEREEQFEVISDDVEKVLGEVVSANKNTNIFMMAKSIGTGGLAHLFQKSKENLKITKVIWLNPLLQIDTLYDCLRSSRKESLLLTGNKDQYFVKERMSELADKRNFKTRILKGADHSLEHEDGIYQSIECMKVIMKEIDMFTNG